MTTLIILMLSVCLLSVQHTTAQTDQAASKLQAANTAINQAFNAVLDAEKAGANVTDLLPQLSYAQGVLANAENSYRTGAFTKASIQADNVLPIVEKVTVSAQNSEQTALDSGQNAFWSTIAFTVIGAIVFVLALFLVWRWFKRSYIKNLSDAKPELVSND